MTLTNIRQGDVLTVRVFKQFAGYSWANNYEVEALQDLSNPVVSLEALVTRIANLERPLHISSVIIDRATVSTYVPDSLPYNPNTLATFLYRFLQPVQLQAEHCRWKSVFLSRRSVKLRP